MSDLFKVADPAEQPTGSILLLHGLGGHHYDTWRLEVGRKPWNLDETFWPAWLARDCASLAIYVVGYNAAVSRLRGTAMHLTDQATSILARVNAESELAQGPLTLIGHSLGGLVIKQILRTADSMARYDKRSAGFIERVERVAFLGTPHLGSGLATWGDRLRILVRPSSATASLVRNDPNLRDLNNWYRDWANARGITHLVLTETQRTSFLGTIVSPDSADPGLANVRPIAIDANHSNICKPSDDTRQIYILVRDFNVRLIEKPKPLEDALVERLVAAFDARASIAAKSETGVERRTVFELCPSAETRRGT
ncbi:esterase/lipase family protein [Bradyrhizobium sp. AZCC 2230]|uniref:esterase/lipase family protein n=1 Tax=Bradyrhizobium sp. AZCC 2230 TaxID=3117021 RepID=UPI002FEF9FA1